MDSVVFGHHLSQRVIVTGGTGEHLIERGYDVLDDRAALIPNRRAKQVLGWKQEFFLR